jgi:hypothetical protein
LRVDTRIHDVSHVPELIIRVFTIKGFTVLHGSQDLVVLAQGRTRIE